MNAICAESADGISFELREQNELLLLELCGEFGSLHWRAKDLGLERSLYSAIQSTHQPRMLVDLSGVTYAGSEFIEFLLGLRKRVTKLGGILVLSGVQGNLETMLRILHLDQILPQYATTAEAVGALSES